MGFSISVSAATIGVAIIMILEVSMGTIIPLFTDLNDSYENMRNRIIEEIQTEIEINNITVQPNASLHDITITVKNTGSTVIDVAYLDLLVNGLLSSFSYDDEYWFSENTYTITVHGLSGSGSNKVKIITENGISDYHSYLV